MKFQPLLFLALGATAAPAPADSGPTVPARRLLCSGLWTGNDLGWGDINTDGRDIAQKGIWITYNHQRDDKAETALKYNEKIVCTPQSSWRLKCNPSG
uniref:Uncharacterized protein n=1 Tax=Colletotrichum fructicola (strain Nara gc5) TaxID=1213859 RepID=L2FDS9_COLFN